MNPDFPHVRYLKLAAEKKPLNPTFGGLKAFLTAA
jgi:hypothetical protein